MAIIEPRSRYSQGDLRDATPWNVLTAGKHPLATPWASGAFGKPNRPKPTQNRDNNSLLVWNVAVCENQLRLQ